MTREHAKELAPIIAAYAEGKTIQFLFDGKWTDDPDPMFSRNPKFLRIKPEPRKVWVNIYYCTASDCIKCSTWDSEAAADKYATEHRIACHEVELPPAE